MAAFPLRLRTLDNALWVPVSMVRKRFDDEVELGQEGGGVGKRALLRRPNDIEPRTKEQLHYAESLQEVLIPIRIDFEVDGGNRIRDVLTWNLNEPSLTPRKYAEIFCLDAGLPVGYVELIAETIHTQIQEFKSFVKTGIVLDSGHVPIRLELQVGRQLLRDKFMWDISPENTLTPETFAAQMAADLGLPSEFCILIAHSVREQIQQHLVEYQTVELDMDAIAARKGLLGMFRPSTDADEWCPEVDYLDDEELEAIAKTQERNARRLRRESSKVYRRR